MNDRRRTKTQGNGIGEKTYPIKNICFFYILRRTLYIVIIIILLNYLYTIAIFLNYF